MLHNKNQLIEALNLEKLSESDREEILAKVDKRLEEVLAAVLVANISDEEAKKIHDVMKEKGDLEEVVAQIASRVPGLSVKIEQAITREILIIKTALGL